MIDAVTNSTVPHITINMGGSFGAGNYGMSGRAYDPRFMFSWVNTKLAVMGAARRSRPPPALPPTPARSRGKLYRNDAM